MKFRIAIITLLTLAAGALQAQPDWKVRIDTNGTFLPSPATITLGDQVDLVLTAQRGPQAWPSVQQLSQNDILALDQRVDTLENGSFELHTTLTSFEEGEHLLGLPNGDSLLIVVNDVEGVDTTSVEIKDLAGLMRVPPTWREIWPKLLISLAVLLLIGAAVYVIIRLKKHQPIIALPQAPPEPDDQKALRELETLRTQEKWQHGRVKEYHTELTDIVRQYMEASLGIQSTEMTSDQTLEAYQESACYNQADSDRLRQMLRTADMVKFAKSEPQPYEHDQSMQNAKEFVHSTADLLAAREAEAAQRAEAKGGQQ